MTDIQVDVGQTNGDGRTPVVYRFGDKEYPDRVDVSSGFQREQSLRRALDSFGLPADNLPGA